MRPPPRGQALVPAEASQVQRTPRPDPLTTPRRPQAPARPAVAYRSARATARVPFMADGRFDPARWYALLEEAALALEGAPAALGAAPATPATDRRFFGSATWTLDLPAELLGPLRVALAADPRARRAVDDLVFRELARLMGPDLPEALEVHLDLALCATGLRLTADVEGAPAVRVGGFGI